MFGYFAYLGAYVTVPAMITATAGEGTSRQYTLSYVSDPRFRTNRLCRTTVKFEGVRTVMNDRFCLHRQDYPATLVLGTRVVLIGKDSILGFRFMPIEIDRL